MGDQQGNQRERDLIGLLRDEFREHLVLFYSRLKLAAPYDSVEKAVGSLATRLKALPDDELQQLPADAARRWTLFRQAFVDSGLSLKHRGIIAGLARAADSLDLPPEFDHLLSLYRPSV